jgi:hypothetical protein
MTAKDWIIEKIKDLVIEIPEIKVRYENHIDSNTHFIEVTPSSAYNKRFKELEEEITFGFIEQFPSQNICFVDEHAIIGIELPDYSEQGNMFEYNQHSSHKIEHAISNSNSDLNSIIYQTRPVVLDIPQFKLNLLDIQSIKYSSGKFNHAPISSPEIKGSHITAGENTYAMAA